jgi:hypothetical protein
MSGFSLPPGIGLYRTLTQEIHSPWGESSLSEERGSVAKNRSSCADCFRKPLSANSQARLRLSPGRVKNSCRYQCPRGEFSTFRCPVDLFAACGLRRRSQRSAEGSWKAAESAGSLAPLTAKNSSSEAVPNARFEHAVNNAAQPAQELPCQESVPNHLSV